MTVKKSVSIERLLLSMITAPLLVAWGFDDKTRGFWFWLLLTALFLVVARG